MGHGHSGCGPRGRFEIGLPEGLLAMWLELREQETFPAKYLVSARQTLEEFIHDHDSSYRNDAG